MEPSRVILDPRRNAFERVLARVPSGAPLPGGELSAVVRKARPRLRAAKKSARATRKP